jgi:hypothetical protein
MKQIQSCLIFFAICFLASACHKDTGNYNYTSVNEITFQNIKPGGYVIRGGDTLKIEPNPQGTQEADGTKGTYSYRWSLEQTVGDSVISTEKNLSMHVTLPAGPYTLQYRVKDEQSGITFQTKTKLLVTTRIYEGYLVMSEVNGGTRLDMLTFDHATQEFEQLTDVLSLMGSQAPVQGEPVQIFCMESEAFSITPDSYRIYLVTDNAAFKINPETFAYQETDDFRYEMLGPLPGNFKPTFVTGYMQYSFMPVTVMMEGNNAYRRVYQGAVFPYVPINVYPGEPAPFRAFPELVANDDFIVLFDMDKRVFTSTQTDGVYAKELNEDYGFPVGKDLVYMEDHQATMLAYAILKDPGAPNYHLFRFYPGFEFSDLYQPINNATDLAQATHYAVHPQHGYVIYSVGGKVYEYDPFLQSSVLMLDKGSAEITHLSFQEFFNPLFDPRYSEMNNLLSVGTYDPSGVDGNNGTFELFNVPDANRPFERLHSWNGFGKIKSIAYRERQ